MCEGTNRPPVLTCRLLLVLGKESFPPLLGPQPPPGQHVIQKNSSLSPDPQVLNNLFLAGQSENCPQSVGVSLGTHSDSGGEPHGVGELHTDRARKGF